MSQIMIMQHRNHTFNKVNKNSSFFKIVITSYDWFILKCQ